METIFNMTCIEHELFNNVQIGFMIIQHCDVETYCNLIEINNRIG